MKRAASGRRSRAVFSASIGALFGVVVAERAVAGATLSWNTGSGSRDTTSSNWIGGVATLENLTLTLGHANAPALAGAAPVNTSVSSGTRAVNGLAIATTKFRPFTPLLPI